MKILKETTLNIFCDASISSSRLNGGLTIGCPGALLVTVERGEPRVIHDSYKIIYGTTSNNAEINAILLGVKEAIAYRSDYTRINLFSDSRICILGLRDWIFAWIDRMTDDGALLTTAGTPVANQDVILHIMHLIVTKRLDIRLFHQKSHVNSSIESLEAAKNLFYISNTIILDIEEVRMISYFNNMVDIKTKEILKNNFDNEGYPLRQVLEYPIEFIDVDVYKQCIRGDEKIV